VKTSFYFTVSAKITSEMNCTIVFTLFPKRKHEISSNYKFCCDYNLSPSTDLQQICVKLWCEVPGGSGNCKTAEMPAADGTPCGDSKVILNVLFDHSGTQVL